MESCDFGFLAFDVAGVLRFDLHLSLSGGGQVEFGKFGEGGCELFPVSDAAHPFFEALALAAKLLHGAEGNFQFCFPGFESSCSFGADGAQFDANGCEPAVGVVVSEQEAVFCAGGEHAIGFIDTFGDEIVNQDSEVGLAAVKNKVRAILQFAGGIDAGDESLPGGFFVAGGAVDLSGEIESFDSASFERGVQLGGGSEVIFNRVAVAHDLSIFAAWDAADDLILNIAWEAGGDTVAIDFLCVAAFRFEKDLMGLFFGEADNFVFD